MADIYKAFYRYHNDTENQTNNLSFTSLNDLLPSLENSYRDKEGKYYNVGIWKNDCVWNSLVPVNHLIETVKTYLGKGSKLGEIWPSQYKEENTTMASKTAFEYTVILHALPVKDNSGNDVTPDSEIILQPTTVVALDSGHVGRIASRKIDSKITDSDLARVEIKVRTL